MATDAPTHRLTFIENFILSGMAAGISKTMSAPMNQIKLFSQLKGYKNIGLPSYKGAFYRLGHGSTWIKIILATELDVIRYFPTQMVNFALKDSIKSYTKKIFGNGVFGRLCNRYIGGAFAGMISLGIVYPMDCIMTRSSVSAFNPEISVIPNTFIGLYSGYPLSVFGIFMYRATYFGLYDTSNVLLGPDYGFFAKFLIGLGITNLAGILTYPIDKIRRIQIITEEGVIEIIKTIWEEEGILGFFSGVFSNVLRGLLGALVLALFDTIKQKYINTLH